MPNLPDMPFSFSVMPLMASIAKWLFYFLVSGAIIGVFYMIYYRFIAFPIKIYYWPLYGSSKDGVFSIGKMKSNRAAWGRGRKFWKTMWPLLSKKKHPPFDAEYIYPGNVVYAFKLNQDYVPGRLNASTIQTVSEEEEVSFNTNTNEVENIAYDLVRQYYPIKVGDSLDENAIRGSLDPIDYHLQNWHESQLKENEIEFRAENWWDQNKNFFMMLGTSLICLVMVGVCAYFVYKMMSEGRPEAAAFTKALNNFANSVGAGRGVTPT